MFGTVNANQRLPIRLLTACGVLAATLGAAGAIAPSPHAGKLANNSQALGYDSRLWQSVYHPDNPRDAPDRPAAADAFHSGPTGVPMQNAVPMQNTLRVAGGEPIGFEPLGQLIVDEDPGGGSSRRS